MKMSQNMEKLTNSIADGFALMQQLMTYQPVPMYPPQAYNPYMQEPNSFTSGMPSYPPSGHSHIFPPQSDTESEVHYQDTRDY